MTGNDSPGLGLQVGQRRRGSTTGMARLQTTTSPAEPLITPVFVITSNFKVISPDAAAIVLILAGTVYGSFS